MTHRRRVLAIAGLAVCAVVLLGARITHSPLFPPGAVNFLAGSCTAPSATTAGDTDTGFAWLAANAVSVCAGGAESLRVHAGGLMAGVENSFDLGTASGSRFRHLHLTGAITSNGAVTWRVDNASDLGTSATAGRPRDAFVARDLHVAGFIHIQATLAYGAHVVTIASNGVSGTANAETLSGLRALYLLDCLDGDGCTVTLAETSVTVGTLVRLVNISTSGSANHNITLSDAAPLHLAGALTLTADDVVTLIYVVNRSGDGNFYEVSRSAN